MRVPVARGRPAALTAAALAAGIAVAIAGCAATTAGTGHPGVAPAATPSGSAPSGPATSSGTASASPTRSGAAPPIATRTVVAADGTRYPIQIWAQRQVPDCAAHAYGGPVVAFLRRHPCQRLRQLLATTAVGGRAVGLAQRTIVFAGTSAQSAAAARRFDRLVSRSGTGNLDDLLREGVAMPGTRRLPIPNAFSALSQDGGVTVVEAWYQRGATPSNDPALVKMARDLFLRI